MRGIMRGSTVSGHGALRFPSSEALVAWLGGTAMAQPPDPSGWLGPLPASDVSVGVWLAHSESAVRGTLCVETRDDRLTLTYQDHDGVEGQLAQLVRVLCDAGRHGAEGELFFVDRIDGEPADLAHRVVVGAGSTRIEPLSGRAARAAYGPGLRELEGRLRTLEGRRHPTLVALDRWIATGSAPAASLDQVHARVVEALADCPDARLARHAQSYGGYVLDARGKRQRFTAKQTRALLRDARSDEHRAAALFALRAHAPERALPLAIAALEAVRDDGAASPACEVAMQIAAAAGPEHAGRLLPLFVAPFERDWPLSFATAARALADLELDLTPPLRALIARTTDRARARPTPWDDDLEPGAHFADLVERRALPLWEELARYVERASADRGRFRLVERIVRAADPSVVRRLLASDDGVIAVLAERALAARTSPI